MSNSSKTLYNRRTVSFKETRGGSLVIAFCLGMAIIAVAVVLGRSLVFQIIFLALSIIMTLWWRKNTRPWISLVSISSATPIFIAKQQFTCNLVFAAWFALFNARYLFMLPKWIYLASVLAILGITTSSINWMSGDIDVFKSIMRQGAFGFNYFLGPFLLLPVVYLRMRESKDPAANLRGLLYFLIIPSTLLLVSAKLFGSVTNWYQASQHTQMLPEGFLMYRLGNVYVNFLRTEIGFILAALICASTAIAVSDVKGKYRLLALTCLVMNVFLLFATASFGSMIACFLGLAAIFYIQVRKISANKVLLSVVIMSSALILSYAFAPESTKTYLGKRFEHRVTNVDTDRFTLWGLGIDAFLEHPEGVGLTLKETSGRFIHNDYIVYAVSYGIFGGLGYAVLVIGLILSFLRRRRTLSNDPAALAVYLAGIGVLIALAANSITDHSNENRWYFNVIWSIIWYCYFCSYPLRKSKNIPVVSSKGVN